MASLEAGTTSYEDYINKQNDLDQERRDKEAELDAEKLNKQKELAEQQKTIWDDVNAGIIQGLEESMLIYQSNMTESLSSFATNMGDAAEGVSGSWDMAMSDLGDATGDAAKQAGANFLKMVASGQSAMIALEVSVLNAAIGMATSALIELIPATFTAAFKSLPFPVAFGAAIVAIAGITALINSQKSKAIGRFTGGWMHKNQLYEVGEQGKEYIVNHESSVKNESYLTRMNAGESFQQIAEKDFNKDFEAKLTMKIVARERQLQDKQVEFLQKKQIEVSKKSEGHLAQMKADSKVQTEMLIEIKKYNLWNFRIAKSEQMRNQDKDFLEIDQHEEKVELLLNLKDDGEF